MATETQVEEIETGYSRLLLSSAAGPVYRRVKNTPARNALPEEVPLIDISGIHSDELVDRKAVAEQIHNAASNTGFFYVKNHRIPSEFTEAAYKSTLAFFKQSNEIKECVNGARSVGGMEGWRPPQSQQLNSTEGVDQRETFSMRYSPSYDPIKSHPVPDDMKKLQVDSEKFLWENDATQGVFREDILRYWSSCLSLARKLLATFALGLGLEEDAFDTKVNFPDAVLALNYYPTLDQSSKTPDNHCEQVSIGSHTDFQLLTILFQDQVGGLQILNPSGEWINAIPIPDTLVINIGDLMQRITNDRYLSTVHRARNFSGKERVSMPFFFGFGLNERAEVLGCCVDEKAGRPKKYEAIGCDEWIRRRAERMYIS